MGAVRRRLCCGTTVLLSCTPNLWEDARAFGLCVGWAQSSLDANGVGGMPKLSRSRQALSTTELAENVTKMRWLVNVSHLSLSQIYTARQVKDTQPDLSLHEIEVLQWMVDGKTSSEVSKLMTLSEITVDFHIKRAVAKLEAFCGLPLNRQEYQRITWHAGRVEPQESVQRRTEPQLDRPNTEGTEMSQVTVFDTSPGPARKGFRSPRPRLGAAAHSARPSVVSAAIQFLSSGEVRRDQASEARRPRVKPIEEVEVGDLVWAWDSDARTLVKRPVVRLFQHAAKPVMDIVIRNGDGESRTISATVEHPFWVESQGWVSAKDLAPGDRLKQIDEDAAPLRVASVGALQATADVFNFEVAGVHNYFVGIDGVLVHNSSSKARPADGKGVGVRYSGLDSDGVHPASAFANRQRGMAREAQQAKVEQLRQQQAGKPAALATTAPLVYPNRLKFWDYAKVYVGGVAAAIGGVVMGAGLVSADAGSVIQLGFGTVSKLRSLAHNGFARYAYDGIKQHALDLVKKGVGDDGAAGVKYLQTNWGGGFREKWVMAMSPDGKADIQARAPLLEKIGKALKANDLEGAKRFEKQYMGEAKRANFWASTRTLGILGRNVAMVSGVLAAASPIAKYWIAGWDTSSGWQKAAAGGVAFLSLKAARAASQYVEHTLRMDRNRTNDPVQKVLQRAHQSEVWRNYSKNYGWAVAMEGLNAALAYSQGDKGSAVARIAIAAGSAGMAYLVGIDSRQWRAGPYAAKENPGGYKDIATVQEPTNAQDSPRLHKWGVAVSGTLGALGSVVTTVSSIVRLVK